MRVFVARLSIAQWASGDILDLPPGSEQYRVPGRDVPFHGAPQPRIYIRLASCHQAQLQRGTRADQRGDLASRQKCIERSRVAMRAASNHRQSFCRHCATVNLPTPCRILDEGTAFLRTGKQAAQRRGENHPQHGYRLAYQCDVYGKLTIAPDKLLRTIKRIHEPENTIHAGCISGCNGFLRDDRHLWRQGAQRGQNNGLCAHVSFGYG